jgi:hypothetical protein
MSSSNTSHHPDVALIRIQGARRLGRHGALSSVALVSRHTFIRIELVLQGKSKNRNIVPFPSRKRAIKPDNMARFDAETKLVRHTWLLKLVAVPTLSASFDWTVGPINRQKAVTTIISDPSLFKVDLTTDEAMEASKEATHALDNTYHVDFELRNSINKVPGMISPSLLMNASSKCSSNSFFWILPDQEEIP